MKKFFLLLLVAVSIISCKEVANGHFVIEGNANGVTDGSSVFLQTQDSTGLVQVDTVKVENGKFKFEGQVTNPSLHFIQIDKINGKAVLVLETGAITMEINKDSIGKSKVGGTLSNDHLSAFSLESEKIQKRMVAFQMANMAKFQEAQAKKDTATINSLLKQNSVFEKEFADLSMTNMEKNPKSYLTILFLQQSLNNPNADMTKLKTIYDNLDENLKNTSEAKKIKKRLDGLSSTAIGNIAPDFKAPGVDGKVITLKESLGKVTIIDFWASWCGPCRKDNPNMVAIYNEFHTKGLNIIGVSLDKDANDWKEAIAKDKLTWTQVSNLKHWEDPIAMIYGIQSIPSNYILDATGKIIAKDLHAEELKAKIASLLGA
ncbi:MAG: redoxin domain-containing protein [Flavobacterium sp.]